MTRRRFLQAFAAAPLSGAAVSRAAPAPVARPQIVPPDASFMATLPGLLEVSSVPGISIGVVQRGRVVWQAQDRVAAAMAPTASPDQGIPLLPGSVYYPNPAMSLMTRVPDYLAAVARFTRPVSWHSPTTPTASA